MVTNVEAGAGIRGGRAKAMPTPEETGWGQPRLRVGGEADSHPLFSGYVCSQEQRIPAPISAAGTAKIPEGVHEPPSEGASHRFAPNSFGVSDRCALRILSWLLRSM